MTRAALLLALLAANSALGQRTADATPDNHWDRLVAQLADPMRRDFAIAEMDALGPSSVGRLVASVDPTRPEAARQLFYAISELAHHAAADYDAIAALTQANPNLQADLFDLRTTLLAFLGRDTMEQAWGKMLLELQRTAQKRNGDEEFVRRLRRLWVRFNELQVGPGKGQVALTGDLPVEELIKAMPDDPRPFPHYAAAVARLLSRHSAKAAPVAPRLHRWMRTPVEAIEGYEFAPTDRRWSAVALTRIAPATAEAIEAHGYLARRGNPLELERALAAIREHPAMATNAVPHLIAALSADDAVERTAVQKGEIITTLSTLGTRASQALPTLREIARGEDRRSAALASAAVRSIDRR